MCDGCFLQRQDAMEKKVTMVVRVRHERRSTQKISKFQKTRKIKMLPFGNILKSNAMLLIRIESVLGMLCQSLSSASSNYKCLLHLLDEAWSFSIVFDVVEEHAHDGCLWLRQ